MSASKRAPRSGDMLCSTEARVYANSCTCSPDRRIDPDWDLPYRFVKGQGLAEWERFGIPTIGIVLRPDGSSASDVGVQPIECPLSDHIVPMGLPTVSTTSASGSFTTFPGGMDVCGFRIWMGPRFHETKLEDRSGAAVVIRLPEAGAERHGVLDWRSRDFGDPHGAWLRGRVVRDGQGVPDVDVSAVVLPIDNMEAEDSARTGADGSFELYVSSRDLDESHNVLIGVHQRIWGLRGRQVVRVSPGEARDGVTIEVGTGVVVSGVVVDEQGDPVSAVRVECEPWGGNTAPTGRDGRFRMTLPVQGRCRLHAIIDSDTELTPATGLAPKIDVTRPDGSIANVRFVVRRADARYFYRHGPGYVDLGVKLHHEVVQAVGDELEAAGLRVGDEIVSATEGGQPLEEHQLFRAGAPPWGEDVAITVKRGTRTIDVRAKAPAFEPMQH